MTTIAQHSQYATLINVFVVEPDRAADLAALLVEATENVMRHRPGFRSANIHVSTDRTRVLNYAQWDSPEAYGAMLADADARVHMEQAASLASSFDPHLYTVESVHENV
jgi:antibiotic biosynthesis monooxygenase (ABM) superfamily enzyme